MGDSILKTSKIINSSDLDTVEVYRRSMRVQKNAGAATVSTDGLAAAPTLTATVTNQDSNTRPALRHATAATNGVATGMISAAFTILRAQWDAEFVTEVTVGGTGDGFRATVGFFSANPDAVIYTTGAVPGTSFMGFQTNNPNTGGPNDSQWNWICVTCDGLTIRRTRTFVSTSGGGGTYKLRAVRGLFTLNGNPSTGVQFYIDNVLVATHWDSLPTTTLGYGIRQTNTAAVANNIQWSKFTIFHNG